ncbi:hypothetical protein FRC00_006610 [Tulasnella sp. 408]|nr:hypothetical protein FRC00_006610 [Tulasnella sp. 408]
MASQAKPAHVLVTAIRHTHTPWHKGEAIHREKWYLDLSLEPTPPVEDDLWRDIRASGLGELLLDIVVQGAEGGPIDIGEVHLQISSLQALYNIVRGIRLSWNDKNPLEVALKKKVISISKTLVRLESFKYENPGHLALAREFVVCIISPIMEKFRRRNWFLESIQAYRESLLQTTLTSIFHDARSTGRPDPTLLQNAVIIGAILADSFGFPNQASEFVVSRYGIRKIIDRFQLVLTDAAYPDSAMGGILTGMSAVMLYLWSDDRTHRPLVVDNQIHVLMMDRFWEYQTDRPDDDLMELGPSGLSAVSFLCDIVEYIVGVEKEDYHLGHKVLRKLIIEHDS